MQFAGDRDDRGGSIRESHNPESLPKIKTNSSPNKSDSRSKPLKSPIARDTKERIQATAPSSPKPSPGSKSPVRPSVRKEVQVSRVTEYFLEKVDPLFSACIAYFLMTKPVDNVIQSLHDYFHCKYTNKEGEVNLYGWASKIEQKEYLTKSIAPAVSRLVKVIASHRPDDVLKFVVTELSQWIESSTATATTHSTTPSAAASATAPIVSEPSIAPVAPSDKALVESKSLHVVVIGLDGAGKTSIINALQGNFDSKVRPTIGFRPVSMRLDEATEVKFYDLGGGIKIRDIWPQYYHDVHGVLYIIDGSDESRVSESIQVLQTTLTNEYLIHKPVLVLVNKQDVPNVKTIDELSIFTSLVESSIMNIIECAVIPISTTTTSEEVEGLVVDTRIEQGVEWLLTSIQNRFEELHSRVSKDSHGKQNEEIKKRLERERKVIKNKIAAVYMDKIDPSRLPAVDPPNPDDLYTATEATDFLASEIGVPPHELDPVAVELCRLVGYQRLAMTIVGGLFCPVSKKKSPMTWGEIRALVLGVYEELGLAPEITLSQ